MFTVSPTQSDIQTAIRSFLLSILPDGMEVVEGQDNRVPEPGVDDFVVMWPLRRLRLSTNVDSAQDVRFEGSVAGTVLTVSHVDFGTITPGNFLFGVDIADATKIVSQLSGSPAGGVGTYRLSIAQNVDAEVLSAGGIGAMQPIELMQQLDVHGPNSSDNAQVITTLWRDEFGVNAFKAINPNIAPLYADDPLQMPFLNDSQQSEFRYVIEAHLQANQTVTAPQQYADSAVVGLINVEATYPA